MRSGRPSWRIAEEHQLRQTSTKTGGFVGAICHVAKQGESTLSVDRPRLSWNVGAYSPKPAWGSRFARMVQDWTVVRPLPITDPMAQAQYRCEFHLVPPPERTGRGGHLDARDPVTRAKNGNVNFDEPPLASVLAPPAIYVRTDSRGGLRAYHARPDRSCGRITMASAHCGIISYSDAVNNHIADTGRWGGGMWADEFPSSSSCEPYTSMPKDSRCARVVFTLKQ